MDTKFESPELPTQDELLGELQFRITIRAAEGVWDNMAGDEVPFAEMKQSHAQNIVKFFNEKYPTIRLPQQILIRAYSPQLKITNGDDK